MSNESTIIYFDESGNTEQGFKDKKQPCISFASHNFSEQACSEILKKYFPANQAKEVKYSRLNKKRRLNKCVDILRELKETGGGYFKVYSVYKPLFLFHSFLTVFHDFAYEAKFTDQVFSTGDPDWIRCRLQSLWFYFADKKGLDYIFKLVELFSSLIIYGKKEIYDDLNEHVALMKNESEEADLINNWMLDTGFYGYEKKINNLAGVTNKPSWLDTTIPCIFQLLLHWSYSFDGNGFEVIHDNSWVLQKRKWVINQLQGIPKQKPKKLMSKRLDDSFYIVPDILPIQNFSFEKSEDFYALQIADLLAGMVNESVYMICDKNNEKSLCILDEILSVEGFLHMVPEIHLAKWGSLVDLRPGCE